MFVLQTTEETHVWKWNIAMPLTQQVSYTVRWLLEVI